MEREDQLFLIESKMHRHVHKNWVSAFTQTRKIVPTVKYLFHEVSQVDLR